MTSIDEPVTAGEIEVTLSRVLEHRSFAGATRLRQLLEYVVMRQLEGQGEEIKEYSIAVDVLDKPADFDPQTDSIVRVMLGRVRNALELYYATDGAGDRVHITIPRGGYQPQFERRPEGQTASSAASTGRQAAEPRGKPTRRSLWTALGLIGLGLLAGWTILQQNTPRLRRSPRPSRRPASTCWYSTCNLSLQPLHQGSLHAWPQACPANWCPTCWSIPG